MAAVAGIRSIASLGTIPEIQNYALALLSRKFAISTASMSLPKIQALFTRLDNLFVNPDPSQKPSIASTKKGLSCIERLFKSGIIDPAKLGTPPIDKSKPPVEFLLSTPEKTALFAKCFFEGGSIQKVADISKVGHYGTVSERYLQLASGIPLVEEQGMSCKFACKKPRKFSAKDFPLTSNAKDLADNIAHYNHQTESSLTHEEGILLALGPHKNIVSLLAILEEGMALELAKGTLDVLEKRPITSEEFRNIAKQLFEALEYIHSKNIIHRDIKPTNILISQENQIKICDFGAACFEKIKHYPIGTTPNFLAPECVNYQESEPQSALTTAVDIWAAGIVLYRLLTGHSHPCIVSHPKDKTNGKDMKSEAFHAAYKEFLRNISSRGLAATDLENYTGIEWARVSIFEGLDLDAQTRIIDADPTGCFRRLILNCLNVDRKKRPSAKKLLEMLESTAFPGSAFYTPPSTPQKGTPQSSPQKPKEVAMPVDEKPAPPKPTQGTPSRKRPAAMVKLDFSEMDGESTLLDTPRTLGDYTLGDRLRASPKPVSSSPRPASRAASRLATQLNAFHAVDPDQSTDA